MCVSVCLVCFVFKNSIRVLYISLLSQLPHWVVQRWLYAFLDPFCFLFILIFWNSSEKASMQNWNNSKPLNGSSNKKTLGRWKKLKEVCCRFHFFLWSIFCGLCAWRCMCPGFQCEKTSVHSSVKETSYEQLGSPREATASSKGSCNTNQRHYCHLFSNYFIHILLVSSRGAKWCGKHVILFQIPQWRIHPDLPLLSKVCLISSKRIICPQCHCYHDWGCLVMVSSVICLRYYGDAWASISFQFNPFQFSSSTCIYHIKCKVKQMH